jgi:uncharacterized membrane protein YheB (UPF0754 family)
MILLFKMITLADFKEHWWLYMSMPIIASIIGYATKIVAIKMMFEPLEFLGIKPFLGWQGIIPRKAVQMSTIACDTLTSRLITPKEIFSRLDPKRVAEELEKPMLPIVEKITHDVMSHYQPGLWESIPENVKKLLIKRIQQESPEMVAKLMEQTKENLDEVFDLKDMVITNLTKDKKLLNKIFLESGEKEFDFIRNSGIYFGFLIGLVQMIVWMLTQEPLIMPIFGLFTGWFTDWLALKMIFDPKQEKKYLGIFKWQGLFFKRQKEVASAYGALIAKIFGAKVIALDISDEKLEMAKKNGVDATLNIKSLDVKTVKEKVKELAKELKTPNTGWKIFEISGTKAGQDLAFNLITFASTLSIVGFTMDKTEVRLSNLMAFDAKLIGTWGCRAELYPEVLDLVASGKLKIASFVETFPMSKINEVFANTLKHKYKKRSVLVADFN